MAATNNLGPMPTSAMVPTRCLLPVVPTDCTSADCTGYLFLACAGALGAPTLDTGCWPSATASLSAADTRLGYGARGYYSPAVACPGNYATADEPMSVVDDDNVTAYKVHCCPSGYSSVRDEYGRRVCQTEMTATAYSASLCGSDDGWGDSVDALATTISLPLTVTDSFWGLTWTVTKQTIQAPAIEIRFRRTDLVQATMTAAPTPASQDDDPSTPLGGISRDAKIGLGIGIPVAGIAVVGLLWKWYKGLSQ